MEKKVKVEMDLATGRKLLENLDRQFPATAPGWLCELRIQLRHQMAPTETCLKLEDIKIDHDRISFDVRYGERYLGSGDLFASGDFGGGGLWIEELGLEPVVHQLVLYYARDVGFKVQPAGIGEG